jgi:DNA-binding LytR/AlgR family response regulator
MIFFKILCLNHGFFVRTKAIIRVKGKSNYSCVYFSDGKKIAVAKVLHWFEDALPVEMFARVHKSH